MSIFECIILILAILAGPIWLLIFIIHFMVQPEKMQHLLIAYGTIPGGTIISWIVGFTICIVYLCKAIF